MSLSEETELQLGLARFSVGVEPSSTALATATASSAGQARAGTETSSARHWHRMASPLAGYSSLVSLSGLGLHLARARAPTRQKNYSQALALSLCCFPNAFATFCLSLSFVSPASLSWLSSSTLPPVSSSAKAAARSIVAGSISPATSDSSYTAKTLAMVSLTVGMAFDEAPAAATTEAVDGVGDGFAVASLTSASGGTLQSRSAWSSSLWSSSA